MNITASFVRNGRSSVVRTVYITVKVVIKSPPPAVW